MKHVKTLAGAIYVYEDAWEFPENTIKLIEDQANDPARDKIQWRDAPWIGTEGRDAKFMNLTKTRKISPNPIFHKIYDDFHDAIQEGVSKYYNDFAIIENAYSNSEYQLLKYEKGQKYPKHYDSNTTIGRHVSILLYINDDYEGGELVFNMQNVYIKPKAGMMLVFPSNFAYQHEALEVTKGTKYVLATWLHDRAPDETSSVISTS